MHGFFLLHANLTLDKVIFWVLQLYSQYTMILSHLCLKCCFIGLKKDSTDARSFSFIKILENMPHMKHPPLMLFVENVVGFEVSISKSTLFSFSPWISSNWILALRCRLQIHTGIWWECWKELALSPKNIFWAHCNLESHTLDLGTFAWYTHSESNILHLDCCLRSTQIYVNIGN